MAYTDLSQLIDRFGERMLIALTDRGEFHTGVIDPVVVARAITDTDAMIDGFIAARYGALTTVPPLLADLALAIAIYKLHVAAPDVKIGDDYRDARKMLRDIADGLVAIPGIDGTEPPATGSATGAVRFTDRERELTPDSLRGFI